MYDLLQIAGALAILVPFAQSQRGAWSQTALGYLLLNLLGAALLAVLALIDEQWGFLLLEVAWALVAGWSLSEQLREPAPVRRP